MSLTNGNRTHKSDAKAPRLAKGETADWATVDADAIRECISAVGSIGGAVRYGYTRDGGCYAVGIYGLEKEPYTEYPRPGTDIAGFLRQLAEFARHAGPPIDNGPTALKLPTAN
jgi:hypothetical protein